MEALRSAYTAAAAFHAPVTVPFETYAAHALRLARLRLRRSALPESDERLADALSAAALEDLYLACACEHGAAGAWERFDVLYRGRLASLARHSVKTGAEATAAAADLCSDMIAPPPSGARPGHGSAPSMDRAASIPGCP